MPPPPLPSRQQTDDKDSVHCGSHGQVWFISLVLFRQLSLSAGDDAPKHCYHKTHHNVISSNPQTKLPLSQSGG